MVYAIIPARSGSKGIKDKNISLLAGKELLAYSIEFAKKINVDRIFVSTNSPEYAQIAIRYGAEVPFLRSEESSCDTAMEQDILKDLYSKYDKNDIQYPDIFVWLRPTFVFRDINAVNECINQLIKNKSYSSYRTICSSEVRLYKTHNSELIPYHDGIKDASMVRRQDINAGYKVFSTDVFRGNPKNMTKYFMGDKVGYVKVNKICGLDIDDEIDFVIVEHLVKNGGDLVLPYLT